MNKWILDFILLQSWLTNNIVYPYNDADVGDYDDGDDNIIMWWNYEIDKNNDKIKVNAKSYF